MQAHGLSPRERLIGVMPVAGGMLVVLEHGGIAVRRLRREDADETKTQERRPDM
jgi:hypothetical protein